MADNILTLPDTTTDFNDFKSQFESFYANGTTWLGTLTTQTSTTLIDSMSTMGTFLVGRIIRASEDAFAETAQSDDAIRANAQAQGIRLTRFLPAQIPVILNSPTAAAIQPLTQFTAGGYSFFNREQLNLVAGANNVTLYEGKVQTYTIFGGDGSDLQTFFSAEDGFQVSDQDTRILVNGIFQPKALGGLWNYRGLPAYSDLTLSDGRLLVQFGTSLFGTVPQPNDVLVIQYVVTQGATANNISLDQKPVAISGFPAISGLLQGSTTGGANDKPVALYKNVASGSLGTYSSAVTKPQYLSIIATYPGIVDVVTQAQREINPRKLEWMNIIRVSGLTTSPWTQAQKDAFTKYCQTVSMYAPYFIWQDAVPIPRDVAVDVYVYNSADVNKVQSQATAAIQKLFNPRPGLLQTNFYLSDIQQAVVDANPGLVSYVIVTNPTGPMIVTAPPSPTVTATVLSSGGTLGPAVYAYSVSTTLTTGEAGPPSTWTFPQVQTGSSNQISLSWPAVPGAASYTIWGRLGGSAGSLATVPATTLSFVDNGSLTPTGDPPNTISELPIRYNQLNTLQVNVKFAERQQRISPDNPTRLFTG